MSIMCRGVRGATTVENDTAAEIIQATEELLSMMIAANEMNPEDVASIIFTTTPDLNAEYPALAARNLGWMDSALLCGHEMNVPQGLPKCVRVLVHWNTAKSLKEIKHIYLKDALSLRPDRSSLLDLATLTVTDSQA